MIRLGISGCCGKMGSRIFQLALQDKGFKVTALFEQNNHPSIGQALEGIEVSQDFSQIKNCDCLVEFTNPESTIEHLGICQKFSKAIVIGTTGLDNQQKEEIKKASVAIPVVYSPNMSIGVNLLFSLVKEAAEKLSNGYKVSITEAHHIHKKDKPSGTAKQLAEIINNTIDLEVRDINSIRQGEIVGDHEVCFEGNEDVIRLSHSAKTRDIFARGALFAAKFIVKRNKGLFNMQDVNESTTYRT